MEAEKCHILPAREPGKQCITHSLSKCLEIRVADGVTLVIRENWRTAGGPGR